jgi:endonuclease/exonuclease/phosphatase family metal-dependent hydrolase
MKVVALGLLVPLGVLPACSDDGTSMSAMDGGRPPDARRPDAEMRGLDQYIDASVWEYAWSCGAKVAPSGEMPAAEPPVEDCSAGVWPDLDALTQVCPTISEITREDPASMMTLPPSGETRALPVEIPVSESGSFLPATLPKTWPDTLKVVAWNMEYSSFLDDQIETLATHPSLGDADVYLISEIDRCSARNGVRRAARELARRIEGAYVYGIEFVELSIGRTIGGDTGQAIVSRRPIAGARLHCHPQEYDWFASDDEPRLGQRVMLSADVAIGDRVARVYAVHFESNDISGARRAEQVAHLLDEAQASACGRPIAVGGDFNTWYPTAPELRLFRNAGFEDALMIAGDTGITHPSNDFRLDYLWTRELETTAGGVARDVTTSDHYPIWAVLRLR